CAPSKVIVTPVNPLPFKVTRPEISAEFIFRQRENTDVLLFTSVEVAVMKEPGATGTDRTAEMVAMPLLLVVTDCEPRKVCPSPAPDGSHSLLEKNCTSRFEFPAPAAVPSILKVPAAYCAAVRIGAGERGPGDVTRIPKPPLEKMEFD